MLRERRAERRADDLGERVGVWPAQRARDRVTDETGGKAGREVADQIDGPRRERDEPVGDADAPVAKTALKVAAEKLRQRVQHRRRRRRMQAMTPVVDPHASDLEARGQPTDMVGPLDDHDLAPDGDDTLALLFMCCHPALSDASAIALTLRALGGLTTAEIASAFLVPEATMAQRISRAKLRLAGVQQPFATPPDDELRRRLPLVLHVLYLLFNEGYASSSGADLARTDLSGEAIRLARAVHAGLPEDPEVAGLLALMLLTDARRPSRARADGALVPLAEQDRSRWDAAAIGEGVNLISATLATAPVGPYQLQAAISAVHDEATRADETDWRQILGLYELLRSIAPGAMVTLNRIVAVAMVHGPDEGLRQLAAAQTGPGADPALAGHHRVEAVRAHLLEMTGDHEAAREHYQLAARGTLSLPERSYLESRAGRPGPDAADALDGDVGDESGRRVFGSGREDGVGPEVGACEVLE